MLNLVYNKTHFDNKKRNAFKILTLKYTYSVANFFQKFLLELGLALVILNDCKVEIIMRSTLKQFFCLLKDETRTMFAVRLQE